MRELGQWVNRLGPGYGWAGGGVRRGQESPECPDTLPSPGPRCPGRLASLPSERHSATQTGWAGLAAGRQPGALPPREKRQRPPPRPAPPRNHILRVTGPEPPPRAV